MCLAIPGKVISIDREKPDFPHGKVSFGGTIKDICFAYVPEVKVGDYVLVHVGFALSVIDEKEALETLSLLKEIELSSVGEGALQ